MKIDAHQHYWQLSRGDYGWITRETGLLYADYLPDQLPPLLQRHGINKSIAVQAAATLEETEFLLELCQREASIAGVVGWLDLEGEHFEKELKRLMLNPFFLGLRPTLQKDNQQPFNLNLKVMKSLELLADLDVPVDLLIVPEQLPGMARVLSQIPHLRAVLDHLGNPNIAEGILEPWSHDLAQFSNFSKTYCKLSGMVTRIGKEQDSNNVLEPYVAHTISCFGTERVMYGSDWPVCLLACSYEETMNALMNTLPKLTDNQLNDLFGANAQRFYKIPDRQASR